MEHVAYRVFFVNKLGELYSPIAGTTEILPRFPIDLEIEFEAKIKTYIGFYCFATKKDAKSFIAELPEGYLLVPVRIEELQYFRIEHNRTVIICHKMLITREAYRMAILRFDAENPGYLYSSFIEKQLVGV